eukprot:5778768-Ditylum_brightwellii.AAC.1
MQTYQEEKKNANKYSKPCGHTCTRRNMYICSIPKWCQYLLQNIDFKWDKGEQIELFQQDEQTVLATDGGTTYGIGYFGWVIATVCDVLVTAKGHTWLLWSDGITAHREHLHPCYCVLHPPFCKYHSITPNADVWVQYCDNIAALQIEATITEMGQSWLSQHVKGHQSGPVLSWEAKLNNIVDTLATEACAETTPTMAQKLQFHYPADKIHLILNGNTITRM